MNCEQFQDAMFDPPVPEWTFHANSCAECANLRKHILTEQKLIAKTANPEPPADLWVQIQTRIQNSVAVPKTRIVSWMAIAAALLVAIVGVIFAQNPNDLQNERALKLNIVEVSPEATKSLSGFVPGYDQVDSREALANAVLPFDFRSNR